MGKEIPLAAGWGKGLVVAPFQRSGWVAQTPGASVSALKGIDGVPSIMSLPPQK
jgi:hypothetical protein